MFFFIFEATPRREHSEAGETAGAFASCWIERPTLEEAQRVARLMIEQQGWIVDEPDEAYLIDRSAYDEDVTGLEYSEQALLDREVIVFHTYAVIEEE